MEQSQEKEQSYLSFDEFKKLDARLGTVLACEAVPDSDKLLRFELDCGEEKPRQILSGIREWYPEPEKLIGKQMLFVINLAPRMIRGFESQGMLMAVDGADGAPVFLVADQRALPGAKVR